MTAAGHPRAIFQRAIERHNLAVAETVLRAEIPRPTLADLLELTALIAQKDPGRRARVTTRWLQRWLEACPHAVLGDAAFVVACLGALGGANHRQALDALREIARRHPSDRPA